MSRRRSLAIAAAALLFLAPLSACAPQQFSSGSTIENGEVNTLPFDGDAPLDGAVPFDGSAPGSDLASAGSGVSGAEAPVADSKRSIIRTVDLSLTVESVTGASDRVTEVATKLGGIVESQETVEATATSPAYAYLTVRVPAKQLEDAFTQLSEIGEVDSQSRSASDVTTQHVDLQARIKALDASVERLTKLMTDATSTADLLEAESALSARQQELDGLNAQLKSLEGQVEEATIRVSLTTPSVLPGGGPTSFWDGLVAGVNSLGAFGSGAVVLLGILLPWIALAAIIAGAVVWIVRGARRRRNHARAELGAAVPAEAPAQAQPQPQAPAQPEVQPEAPSAPEAP